jgi:hypothetical protein
MAPDLFWLVCTALLSLLIPSVYLIGRVQTPGGTQWAFGNRDTHLPVPAWTERAVLTAHAAGKSSELTAMGAAIFFWARVAHVAVYTAGIIGLRTLVFFVGAVGEVMILIALFR